MSLTIATRDAIATLINIDSADGTPAEIADRIMSVIECDDRDDLLESSDAAQDRARECFTLPRLFDLQLHAINALLDCHGLECIFNGETEISFHCDDDSELLLTYLNTGNSYSATIAFDHSDGTWIVASLDGMIAQATSDREPSDDACIDAANLRFGLQDDGCRDYVIYEADEIGGKRVKVERSDAIDLGRRIIAANAAHEIDPESPDAADPYSRWCADTDCKILGETPGDFEPEITLEAGEIVVRMQYRDGGGEDCRGDYRYEITVDGETWYDDGLQSARWGFGHAADSVAGFQKMACSMLSFTSTDDLSAEFRAPETMQDALENANCDVSEPDDGSDKPRGWTVVDDGDDAGN